VLLEDRTVLASFPTPLLPVAPSGGLIYQGSADGVIAAPAEADTYTLTLEDDQSVALVAHPTAAGLQPAVTLSGPDGTDLSAVTAPAPGADAVLQAFPIQQAGTYTFAVSGASSSTGAYTLHAILSAGVEGEGHGGPANDALSAAQRLDATAVPIGGANDRLAVLGTIAGGPALGDVYISANAGGSLVYRIDRATGRVAQSINSPEFSKGEITGVKLGPDNTLYVGLSFIVDFFEDGISGELVHLDLQGNTLGTIPLPDNLPGNENVPYPFGFDIARDGSFWVAQESAGQVIHVDPAGQLLASFPVASNPMLVAVAPTGHVIVGDEGIGAARAGLYDLDPSTGTVVFRTTVVGSPRGLNFAPNGDLWVSDLPNKSLDRFDRSFVLQQQVALANFPADVQADRDGNVWATQFSPRAVLRFGPSGKAQYETAVVGLPRWLSVLGGEFPDIPALPPPDLVDDYSFRLEDGQSATVVVSGLNGQVQVKLEDDRGKILAQSDATASGFDASIHDFVAKKEGQYYLVVTGDQSTQYSLVITRGADFGNGPNIRTPVGQDINATMGDGTGGAIGAIHGHSPANLGAGFDGIDYLGSSGGIPPDTVAAVGEQYIVEAVNSQIRITDKAGNTELDEPLFQFFSPLGLDSSRFLSDPYVEYDDIAQRWYVSDLTFDPLASPPSTLLFAVSNDANPLHGFNEHSFQVTGPDDYLDFDKIGYNADAVFLTGTDNSIFFDGPEPTIKVITIDKASILGPSPTFVSYVSTPPVRDLSFFIPAEMHGARTGMPEYFVQDSNPFDAVSDHVDVVTMTNFLSDSPTYVFTDIPVKPYAELVLFADQPTAPGMVLTNGTQFTQADWRNGKIATAHSVFEPDDNFTTSRVRWYQIDTTGGTPTLIQQGSIHPGPGVSTYQGSIAQDASGNLGMTYMQSSAREYVSMYVATKPAGTPLGVMGNGVAAAPGLGLLTYSERTGDYSTVEVDPTDGTTFWAANEYIGADGGTNLWRTHIVSFQATVDPGANFYTVRVKGGDSLDIAVTVPGAGPGQFDNAFVPAVYLYDPSGRLVAFDEAQGSNDRTVAIRFQVPGNGQRQYTIRVAPSPLTAQPTEGEYALVVSGSDDDGSDTAPTAAMATSGPIRAEGSGPVIAVGGGDGGGADVANFFAAAIQDAGRSPAAESGSGGAGRNGAAPSALTESIFGTLERPEGPLRVPFDRRPRPRDPDKFDTSRFRVRRKAGITIINSGPDGKTLLKPGATFEHVDYDRS
jgi:streptogramin lyase